MCSGSRKVKGEKVQLTQSLHDILETKVSRDTQVVGFEPTKPAETVLNHDDDDSLRFGERSRVERSGSAGGKRSAVHPDENGQLGVGRGGSSVTWSVDTTCSESANALAPSCIAPAERAQRLTSCRDSLRNRSWRPRPDRTGRKAEATRACRDCRGRGIAVGQRAAHEIRERTGEGRKALRLDQITHLASKRSRGTGSAKRFGPVGGLAYGMVKRSMPPS